MDGVLDVAYAPGSNAGTIKLTATLVDKDVWLAIGFNNAGQQMSGTDAIIVRSSSDGRRSLAIDAPKLFTISGYGSSSVVEKSCAAITNAEASVTTVGAQLLTTLSFEYDPNGACFRSGFGCHVDSTSGELVCDESKLVWAYGSSTKFSKHAKVTGLLLAFAGLFAVVAAVADKYDGSHLWSRERDSDAFPSFLDDPHGHGVFGLVIMALGAQQPLLAMCRPHAPAKGEPKGNARLLWEVCHKGLGYFAVVLALAQIFGGFSVLEHSKNCDHDGSNSVCGEIQAGKIVYIAVLVVLGLFTCWCALVSCHGRQVVSAPKNGVGDQQKAVSQ
eukprot:g613.t1